MSQRGSTIGGEGVDELVGLARLHDFAALNVASIAESRELTIDLLVVGLPEEPDGRIECLRELIACHRAFRQADKDCVTERQYADPPSLSHATLLLKHIH